MPRKTRTGAPKKHGNDPNLIFSSQEKKYVAVSVFYYVILISSLAHL